MRATSSAISALQCEMQGIYIRNSNFIAKGRNDETKFSETTSSRVLRASWMTVHGVRSTGRVGRRKAGAIPIGKGMLTDMPDGWKARYGENVPPVRNWQTSECKGLNNLFYKIEQYFTKKKSILIKPFFKMDFSVNGNIRICEVFLIELYFKATRDSVFLTCKILTKQVQGNV